MHLKKSKFAIVLSLFVFSSLLFLAGFWFWRRGSQEVAIYSPVDSKSIAYELVEQMEEKGMVVSKSPLIYDSTVAVEIGKVKVLFSRDKKPSASLRALQLVQAKIKMEERKPREIDLRFDKVVVRY